MQHDTGRSTASPASPSQLADNNDFTPSSSSLAGRKRKASGAGSRGVAGLTPEQLAKKRANDRDAQRAIRERTKHTIVNLERRIAELTAQRPYQDLLEVIKQKNIVQAENAEIRGKLAEVIAILGPYVKDAAPDDTKAQAGKGGAPPNPAHFTTPQPGSTALPEPPNTPQGQMETPAYQPAFAAEAVDAPEAPDAPGAPGAPGATEAPDAPGATEAPDAPGATEAPGAPEAPEAPEEPEEPRPWPVSREALDHQRANLKRGIELKRNGEKVNFSFLLSRLKPKPGNSNVNGLRPRQTSPSSKHTTYPDITAGLPEHMRLPEAPWSVVPQVGPPTCPLDTLLVTFNARVRGGETTRATGTHPPSYPSVSSLLNPSSNPTLDPLSQFMTDIISKFPDIAELPNQVATLFCMFSLMRWQLHPTEENYERLPEWLRPTPTQLYNSHPAWVDHLPWPRLREDVVANWEHYPFDNWFIPFTSGVSVNWPYDAVDCLLSTSEHDEPVMNPVFERHIRRLENWSLGPLFAETFPELVETAGIPIRDLRGTTPSQLTTK